MLEKEIPNEIPYNDYYEYYSPDFDLHLTPENKDNSNTDASLEAVRVELLQQLQSLQGAPSVQMQEVPPEFDLKKDSHDGSDGSQNDDIRDRGRGRRSHPSELYDDNKGND